MIVYLNGEYLPAEEAKISPLDRGFLFGDGIYEAIPSCGGRTVALQLHIDRMNRGLTAISIENPLTERKRNWQTHLKQFDLIIRKKSWYLRAANPMNILDFSLVRKI